MKYYRIISLAMAIIFASVGLIFLFLADDVLDFFNTIAAALGMPLSPVPGTNFYLILAVGYMYLVSVLAYLMYRHPDNFDFPRLLTHAKLASSILSLGFFIGHAPYLIYITNCLVDGSIGLLTLYFYRQIRKGQS